MLSPGEVNETGAGATGGSLARCLDQPDPVPFRRGEDLIGRSEAHRLADIRWRSQVVEPRLTVEDQDHSTRDGSSRVRVVERQILLELGSRFEVDERPATSSSAEQPAAHVVPCEQRSRQRGRGRAGRPRTGRGRAAPRRCRLLFALCRRRHPAVITEQQSSDQHAHDDGPYDQTKDRAGLAGHRAPGRHLLQGADCPAAPSTSFRPVHHHADPWPILHRGRPYNGTGPRTTGEDPDPFDGPRRPVLFSGLCGGGGRQR